MNPLLCVTAAAPTMAELCRARDEAFANGGADLVEMRLDHTDRPDVAAALAGRKGPVHPDLPGAVGRRAVQRQ